MDFLYTEINIVGVILLILFLDNMKKNNNITIDQRIFNVCLIMNIFIFLFDTGMWLVDGNNTIFLRSINYIVTILYYIFNPLICFFWLLFTDYKIYETRNGLIKRFRFYVIPCIINATLSIASAFTGWLFYIDDSNNYMRGPYFWIMAFVSLFYLTLACSIAINDIIKNGWIENKIISIHLIIFPIGIIAASVIQIMFFGVSIIWICSMLAFASIYINIQNGHISTDHLTGLYNRRHLDQHLQRKIKLWKKDNKLFAIMLDLDNFKEINDKYGHVCGDDALVNFSALLRKACKNSDDFIARMGGDEFIIISDRTEDDIVRLMNDIIFRSNTFNKNNPLKYTLLPSMGYSIYNGDSINSFLAIADHQMYRNKQNRKLIINK